MISHQGLTVSVPKYIYDINKEGLYKITADTTDNAQNSNLVGRGIPFLSVFLQPGLVIVLHLIIEGDAVFRIGPQLICQRLRPGSPAGGGDQQTGGADDRQQTALRLKKEAR